jgi:predicted small metal-binding protein
VGKKSFECKHGGVVCGARITGETEEDVLAKAVEHARTTHGVDLTTSKTLAPYAQSLIRDGKRCSRTRRPPAGCSATRSARSSS